MASGSGKWKRVNALKGSSKAKNRRAKPTYEYSDEDELPF